MPSVVDRSAVRKEGEPRWTRRYDVLRRALSGLERNLQR